MSAGLAADPAWRRLLAAARRSLERTGGSLDGTVSLSTPDEAERLAVIGVTGVHRPAGVNRVTVRLADLDTHLREAYGTPLAAAVGDFRDRPAERRRETAGRDAVLTLAAAGRHAGTPWYDTWLDKLRRDGTLTRVVRSGFPFAQVIAVLDALPTPTVPLPVFAEHTLGDTKALTDSTLRGLVLRALAAWHDLPIPTAAEQERALWELAGVVPDDLASQVLVLNLPADGDLLGTWLTTAAQAHLPLRITLHQLRRFPLTINRPHLYVCENPAVLRAAADRPSAPLICTEGVPSTAAQTLLAAAPPQTTIHWRNDFDPTGLRITTAALNRYPNAVPWRMAAADYAAAAETGVALTGAVPASPWDPPLAHLMSATGRAVMEERLLPHLLSDLR